MNSSVVLRALASSVEGTTAQSLVQDTGLSRRTVELILGGLAEQGWARPVAPEGTGGLGRPARRYRFAADHRLIAGVRIDTDFATAVVADLHGKVLGRGVRDLSDGSDPLVSVDDAATAVRTAFEVADVSLARLGAGAVAAGGVIAENGVVRRLVGEPTWSGFPLADAMSSVLGTPWSAENDANLGALAEFSSGAAKGRSSLAWLIHGRRTGVGFVLNGELHRGAGGAAGELIESRVLHLKHDEDHPIGMLTSPEPRERAAALALVRDAAAGDKSAGRLVDELADRIADLVDVIAWTIAPELVVLGGGLEAAGSELLPRIERRLVSASAPHLDLEASTTGPDAPLDGAVRRALDLFEDDLYGAVPA